MFINFPILKGTTTLSRTTLCHNAESRVLFVVMLGVVALSYMWPRVFIMNIALPFKVGWAVFQIFSLLKVKAMLVRLRFARIGLELRWDLVKCKIKDTN